MNSIKELLLIIGIVIAAMVNTALFVDTRYAKAGQVKSLKRSHQKLEQRVFGNELEQAHQKALDNFFFYRQMERKYPHDTQVKDETKKAVQRIKELEAQIGKLKDGGE